MSQRLAQLGWQESSIGKIDFSTQRKLAKEKRVPECYHAILDSPILSRYSYINTYQAHAEAARKKKGETVIFQHETTRPAIEHGVAPANLTDLNRVSMAQVAVKVNHIHTDSVLFVTVKHAPYRVVSTHVLVEDDNLDCIMLALYNYIRNDEDPNDIFQVGTRLALLAPYMKNSQDDRDKNLMLRCDNPQCVILYDSEDAWLAAKQGIGTPQVYRDSSTLRKKGNAEFSQGNYDEASRFYTSALSIASIDLEDKVACLSNRAEVRLRQERWEEAERDARDAISMQQDHIKAKFRLAKALARLGKGSEALSVANELIDNESLGKKCIRDFVTECQRLAQEEKGGYDYKVMQREALAQKGSIFHADFVCSSVDIGVIIDVPGGGTYRGCKANASIAEGELITASKAFVFAPPSMDFGLEHNIYANTINSQNNIRLVGEVIHLLKNRPSLGTMVYSLSAGDDYPVMHSADITKIDLPRIRCILHSNTFGQTYENEAISDKWDQFKKESQLGRGLTESEFEVENNRKKNSRGSGLWLTESKFNHSCIPNCTWTQIGEHMFIRSSRPIQKGDELCISYTALDMPYETRKQGFANWVNPNVGFSCACERCHLLRTREDLRQLESEVQKAYQNAAIQVTSARVPMAIASEQAMSSHRRRFIMEAFNTQPPHLQHNTVVKLLVFEGTCLKHRGDHVGALKAYQRVTEIGYAVRGTSGFEHFTDLWRVTGAAMACKKKDLAFESLKKIWKAREFKALSATDAKAAFRDLSLKYAMPWWQDQPDYERQRQMEDLIRAVSNDKTMNGATGSKRKKKEGRRR